MTFEEEIAAGVFVDCICLFCGAHLPVKIEDTMCCDEKRKWYEQQKAATTLHLSLT